eukprot:1789629-Pyramimonas_sp.AAC.1
MMCRCAVVPLTGLSTLGVASYGCDSGGLEQTGASARLSSVRPDRDFLQEPSVDGSLFMADAIRSGFQQCAS